MQKALARVSTRQLRALAQGARDQIALRYGERLRVYGWAPLGCDSSRVECARTAELETRLGQSGRVDSAPTVWLTAFVPLGLCLLWSWRLGTGTADERVHLRPMLTLLPTQSLIVADAADMGYELARAVLGAQRHWLWRLASRVDLYTPTQAALDCWEEGLIYYWPQYVQQQGPPPVAAPHLDQPAREAKRDVWLLTSVLDAAQLSRETAALFYRCCWRNEGLFRTCKRTVRKVKFSSRTVALVHREAEVSLLALQVLLAHAD
ncbi:MAG: transposase, partial [Planctomycetaceae bacterium]